MDRLLSNAKRLNFISTWTNVNQTTFIVNDHKIFYIKLTSVSYAVFIIKSEDASITSASYEQTFQLIGQWIKDKLLSDLRVVIDKTTTIENVKGTRYLSFAFKNLITTRDTFIITFNNSMDDDSVESSSKDING